MIRLDIEDPFKTGQPIGFEEGEELIKRAERPSAIEPKRKRRAIELDVEDPFRLTVEPFRPTPLEPKPFEPKPLGPQPEGIAPPIETISPPIELLRKRPTYPSVLPISEEGPSRSVIEALPPALKRGAIGAIQLVARAGRALPVGKEEEYTKLIEKTKELSKQEGILPSKEAEAGVRRWIEEGVEGFVPNVAPQILGGAVGGALGGFPGMVVGWKLMGQVTPIIFGLAEYDRFMEEAREQGISESKARPYAILSGLTEWGLESLANLIEAKLIGIDKPLKVALRDPLKKQIRHLLREPAKNIVRGMAINYPIETLTEVFQEGSAVLTRNLAGLETGVTPWEAAGEAIGPALVITTLFNIGGYTMQSAGKRRILKTLSNPNAPLSDRITASRMIQQGFIEQARAIADQDPEAALQYQQLAVQWDLMTRDAINKKQPIELDQTLAETVTGYDVPKKKEKVLPFEELTLVEEAQPPKKKKPKEAVPIGEEIVQEPVREPQEQIPTGETPPPKGPAPDITERFQFTPAEEIWDKTPLDLSEEEFRNTELISEHEEKIKAEIKKIEGELKALKGKRDPARRKELTNKIKELKDLMDAPRKALEEKLIDEGLRLQTIVTEKARESGIPEEDLDDFVQQFLVEISTERPYIEVNYDKKVSEIFDRLVRQYKPEEVTPDVMPDVAPAEEGVRPTEVAPEREAVEGVAVPPEVTPEIMPEIPPAREVGVSPEPPPVAVPEEEITPPKVKTAGTRRKIPRPEAEALPIEEVVEPQKPLEKEEERPKPIDIPIGATVKGMTDAGREVTGVVAEINEEEGTVLIGLPNGDIREVRAETIRQEETIVKGPPTEEKPSPIPTPTPRQAEIEKKIETFLRRIKERPPVAPKGLLGRAYLNGIESLSRQEQDDLFSALFEGYSEDQYFDYLRGWKEAVRRLTQEETKTEIPPERPPVEAIPTEEEVVTPVLAEEAPIQEVANIDEEIANLTRESLDSLLDEVFGEEGVAPKEPKRRGRPPKRERTEEKPSVTERPVVPTKPLSDIIREIGEAGVTGIEESLKGLYELFGGARLKAFPAGFDEEAYQKAKPHFEAALEGFRKAGKGLKEFVETIWRQFGNTIRPYLRRFMLEKMNLPPEETTEEVTEVREPEEEIKTAGTGREKPKVEPEKRDMGDFQNVGDVWDPEHLRQKIKGKPPKNAVQMVLDEMVPSNIFNFRFGEGATPGLKRLANLISKEIRTFKNFLLKRRFYAKRGEGSLEERINKAIELGYYSLDLFQRDVTEYINAIRPIVEAFSGQTTITGAIGRLQRALFPGVDFSQPWNENYFQFKFHNRDKISIIFDNDFLEYESHFYSFVTLKWTTLLDEEHDIRLTEIDPHKRERNKVIIRVGLPDYREGIELKRTEDFMAPFGFRGVGFGEESWINQEERNRVIPAAYDAFKDLAGVIGAPDKGMSLGGQLAIQFANLGHLVRKAAASYFIEQRTINFTRDNGDGTLSHEWGHAFQDLASPELQEELQKVINTFHYVYDFEAGERLANDLLAKDSPILKRLMAAPRDRRLDVVKETIRQRYENTVRKQTDYYRASEEMSRDYTARNQEMWARAFEAYVYDTLPGTNNYLVSDHVAAGRVGGRAEAGHLLVYPAGKERDRFNESIKYLLGGIEWFEDAPPTLKEGYKPINEVEEELLNTKLNELLDSIEERYNAIWTSQPSRDGRYWYQYDVTGFGPMMQPDGYVAYDKNYVGTGPGRGAVAYLNPLSPDDILDYRLSNILYEGENPTIIQAGKEDFDVGVQEVGERLLEEEPPGRGPGPSAPGDIGTRSGEGGVEGGPGIGTPGKPGDEIRGGEGEGLDGAHLHPPRNYKITDPALNDPKSLNERFVDNIAAIRLLKKLETEDRLPSKKEKDILAKYSGWGGMAEVFSLFPGRAWEEWAEIVRKELTPEERTSAERSSVTAYYTPVQVGGFMWRLAQRLGFNGGLVLDPATGGNGLFMGTMPKELDSSTTLFGVEIDSISARIASRLYPLAKIDHAGFHEIRKPMNRFDLTITNVPFADIVPHDKVHNKGRYELHNYFINKMLDLNAPGTLSLVITSTRTMDVAEEHLKEFAKKADLVGAIRLPSGIFSSTDIPTDILVFRKKVEGSKFKGVPEEQWTTVEKDPSTGLYVNKYFLDNPGMVAGKLEKVYGRFGDEALRVVLDESLLPTLERIATAFPEKIFERTIIRETETVDQIVSAPGTVKEGGLYINEKGEVCIKEEGVEVRLPNSTPAEKARVQIAKDFVHLLDAVRRTIRAQITETDVEKIQTEQENLKKVYDAFVKAHGPVNDPQNAVVYEDTTDASWVLALEDYDASAQKVKNLADIFTKNIVPKHERPTYAESDIDALAMSLDAFGYPNLDYMAKLRGTDTETVLKGVYDKIIENPETGFLETLDEYLSGNIRHKLKVARDMAKDNPEYERNVKLLEAALPPDIPPHRINARIGASWLLPEHLTDFVYEKMNVGSVERDVLRPVFNFNPVTNEWSMIFQGQDRRGKENKAEAQRRLERLKKSVEATAIWGTSKMDFFALLRCALQGRRPVVTYVDPETRKRLLDEEGTQAAEAKLEDIQNEFGRWLFSEPKRASEAAKRFNEIVNTSVPPRSDGSHLTFPGKSLYVLTEKEQKELGLTDKKTLYPHQSAAVWRYLRHGNIYLAHEVGTGKTITMALIAMEARRLRGKKKVLYVTLNDSTMGQAINEIKSLYPLANVLPVKVSTNAERRRRTLQKIALNEFDIAIMRQQDLDRIALSPEVNSAFINEELKELREALEDAKAQGQKILERDIQVRIQKLEQELKTTVYEEAKKKNVYFDDLGIDLLIVDEAHRYKNIPYLTRLTRITGLNPPGSRTAREFFRKTQYLNQMYPKSDAIVLASGTPLTNSLAELYNIQRVLQPQALKAKGEWSFDRWVANYADIGGQVEWDAANQVHKVVTTVRKIRNAGRLLATAFQNIYSVRVEDTPIKRPKIRGGEPLRHIIKPNQYVEDYKKIVRDRALEVDRNPRGAMFEGIPDNLVRIISNMSKVAIDQRLDERYEDTELQEDSKIAVASKVIYQRWLAEKEDKGVQLVYADLGIPSRFVSFKEKTEEEVSELSEEERRDYYLSKIEAENVATGKFNTYDGLKAELVRLGIPPNEIAFIHDADHPNKIKKAANLRALFDKVNSGQIRVLIASTKKGGTGVNIQERVSDIHHLDVWWNFSDWEQRNGRGLRAGNIYTNKEGVYIHNYVTETTVDATRWDKVFAKGKVLHTALAGDVNIDVIEDISEETMSAKLIAAEASGDPLMATHATLLSEVRSLQLEQSAHYENVRLARNELALIPDMIRSLQNAINGNTQSIELLERATALQFVGEPRIFIIEKHGKDIAETLEKIILKTAIPWEPGRAESLFVLGSHVEKEEIQVIDGKEKKVKKITFSPLPIEGQMAITFWDRQGLTRDLIISGDIKTIHRHLAIVEKPKEKVLVRTSIPRTLSETIREWGKENESKRVALEEVQARIPKLEAVVNTPWGKEELLQQKLEALRDVEKRMATKKEEVGDPASGISIHKYKGPVPMMEDIALRSDWAVADDILFPYHFRKPPPIAFLYQPEEKDYSIFFRGRKKAFEPEHKRYRPSMLWAFLEGEAQEKPVQPIAYTIQEAPEGSPAPPQADFWIPVGKTEEIPSGYVTVPANLFRLAERVVGKQGEWRFLTYEHYHYIVHHDIGGRRDAIIMVEEADSVPEGVKSLEREPLPGLEKERLRVRLEETRPPREEIETVTPEELRRIENNIKKILPKGTQIGFVDEIWIDTEGANEQVFKEAIRQWFVQGDPDAPIPAKVKVEGRIRQWRTTGSGLVNLIEVAIKNRRGKEVEATAYHEAWHAIRDFLPERDIAILEKRFGKEGEEREGEAFAKYAMGKKALVPLSLKKIFEKVRGFIEALGNYLDGLGFRKVEDIFERALEARLPFQKVEALRRAVGGHRTIGPFYPTTRYRLILPEGVREAKSEDPEVEKAMEESFGLDRTTLIERAKGKIFKALHSFTRHFPELDSKKHGQVINILKQFERIPEFAKEEAKNKLKSIVENMGKIHLNVFTRVLILEDLLKDYESGLYDRTQKLPFNYKNIDQLQRDLERFKKIAEANKIIREALDRREKVWKELKSELYAYDLINEAALNDSRYFHHQVLQYMAIKAYSPETRERLQYTGLSSKDVRLHRKGWQIAREGSALAFNTNYLESEFEVFSQAVAQIETVKTLDRLQAVTDITEKLEKEAKEKNLEVVYGGKAKLQRVRNIIEELRELSGHPDRQESYMRERIALLKEELARTDPLYPFRQAKYRAKLMMGKLASEGAYDDAPEHLRDQIYALAEFYKKRNRVTQEIESVSPFEEDARDFFDVVNWIANRPDDSARPALGFWKAVTDERAFIREKSDIRAKDLRGEGYTVWQPQKGFQFYMANTITDKVLEQVLGVDQYALYKETGKIKIPGAGFATVDSLTLRKALAVGRRRPEWIIPIEVAKTLDNFRDFRDEGPIADYAQFIQASIKQWMLLNPSRAIKYNLNNLSGDVDIVLAYNHRILTKYAVRATKDLYAYLKGRPLPDKVHKELKEAFRQGVIGSGITVHEIPDISKLGIFKLLTGEKPNLIEKYWNTVKEYTTFRENILRLAAYRFFKDELAKGHKLYGASKVSEIDAIPDQDEKAATLARELIGDYGNVSQAGQWLRKNLIPFYSWMEINAPRYVRLIKNLKHEGKRGRAVGFVAMRAGKVGVRQAAKLGVRMTLLYALVNLWNHIIFPDEEEELRHGGQRQLHLILGRREDGTIRTLRFQGALSDALGWFGLEDFPEDFRDVITGKVEWTKKLKEAILAGPERLFHGARPLEKAGLEALAGRTFYPDITRPRPIRDKAEHILRVLSLDLPYRYATGKPMRSIDREIEALITYRTDPGEVAYYRVINLGRDFLKEQGFELPSFQPTEKSNLLYYYKQAQRIGDKEAAQRFMEKYIEAGGTKQDLLKSIKKSHPLAIIPKELRNAFLDTLDAEDKMTLERAIDWWAKTYGG